MARPAIEGLSDTILNCALARFSKHGVAETSIAKIAEDAQVAIGTVYLYFKSKREILRACGRRFHSKHELAVRRLLANEREGSGELLKQYVLGRYDHWAVETGQSRGISDFAMAIVEADPAINRAEQELWSSTILTILSKGQKQKAFHFSSISHEAKIFFQCLIGFFPLPGAHHPFQPKRGDLEDMIDWFIDKWSSGRN